MLNELKAAHQKILDLIDALEALTREAQPDATRLTAVRLALTRASRCRSALLDRVIYPQLVACGDLAAAQAVRTLQSGATAQMLFSSNHIATWGIKQVLGQWNAYREASDRMRAAMRDRVAAEQAALYPLLAPRPLAAPVSERV